MKSLARRRALGRLAMLRRQGGPWGHVICDEGESVEGALERNGYTAQDNVIVTIIGAPSGWRAEKDTKIRALKREAEMGEVGMDIRDRT